MFPLNVYLDVNDEIVENVVDDTNDEISSYSVDDDSTPAPGNLPTTDDNDRT